MYKKINIFIGGSINQNISQNYKQLAIELGQKINERKDWTITFDGCLGLPFLVFNELNDSSECIIYKTRYYTNEYIYQTSAIIHEFKTQSDFISCIPRESDAMIFMKGGTSTIAELMYAIECKKNQEHDKPIIILNVNHEWNDFIGLLNTLGNSNLYFITDNVTDALNYIEAELFKPTSSFFMNFASYIERKNPNNPAKKILSMK